MPCQAWVHRQQCRSSWCSWTRSLAAAETPSLPHQRTSRRTCLTGRRSSGWVGPTASPHLELRRGTGRQWQHLWLAPSSLQVGRATTVAVIVLQLLQLLLPAAYQARSMQQHCTLARKRIRLVGCLPRPCVCAYMLAHLAGLVTFTVQGNTQLLHATYMWSSAGKLQFELTPHALHMPALLLSPCLQARPPTPPSTPAYRQPWRQASAQHARSLQHSTSLPASCEERVVVPMNARCP
jgi:hypothetical protein